MNRKIRFTMWLGGLLSLVLGLVAFGQSGSIQTGWFTVDYPQGWSADEESISDEESYAKALFYTGEDLQAADMTVRVTATREDADSFRDTLIGRDISLESYADGSARTVSISGVSFAVPESGEEGIPVYLYRHVPSGVSYTVSVDGDRGNSAVSDLLSGISLTLTDEGNVDPLWPWEGQPFTPKLAPQMAGSYTITPAYLPFQESQAVQGIMDHQIARIGNTVYHLYADKLTAYDDSTGELVFVSSLELDDDYEYLSADQSGMLYVSQGIFEVIGVKDGQKVMQTTISGDLVMHPSGQWGISFWVNSDTQRVTNHGDSLSAEPWILTGLTDDQARQGIFKMLQDVAVTDQHILVAGNLADESADTKIAVYDSEGNQRMLLGGSEISDPDCLGWITGMVETANGFMAADGNMRRLYFWSKDGNFIGVIQVKDLLGTDYPWLEDMQLMEDGSVLLALTQEREDESADELMLFRLTGF